MIDIIATLLTLPALIAMLWVIICMECVMTIVWLINAAWRRVAR